MLYLKQLTIILFSLFSLNVIAAGRPVPAPPTIGAQNYYLIDYHSGRILAEKNPDVRIAPASLTKLMTAFVVFSELSKGNIKLDEEVTISERAWRTGGSRMFIEVGKRVSVDLLLKGMIIQSGNDASVALAEHVAGGEDTFAQFMNQYASELGMVNTHFMNATGLPHKEHYSSARDIAILTRNLIQRFPDYYSLYSQKSFTYNKITQQNRNKLLWRDPTVDGVKTGYTASAGYCLVSSAEREGMRLVSVVLGAKSTKARTSQSQALLNYGFRFYETRRIYAGMDPRIQPRIWQGAKENITLGIADDLFITIPRGEYSNLNASTNLPETIMAPINKGTALGTVTIKLGEEVLAERPLIAIETVAEGSLWQIMVDKVKMWFE